MFLHDALWYYNEKIKVHHNFTVPRNLFYLRFFPKMLFYRRKSYANSPGTAQFSAKKSPVLGWVVSAPSPPLVVPLWPAGPRAFQGLSSTVKLYFVLHHLPYRVKLRIRVGYRANPLKKKHNKNSCFKKPNLRKFEYTVLNDFKTDMKPGAQN